MAAATRVSFLRWYYLATPLFWLVGAIWGVNVRVAFLDDFPVGRNAYYLLCFVLGVVMLREDKAKLESARKVANIFKFISPSYYIPGKQAWGAF